MGLSLSRRVGERLLIGPDVELIVTRIDGGKVTLNFTAPPEVRIDRPETRKKRERAPDLDIYQPEIGGEGGHE